MSNQQFLMTINGKIKIEQELDKLIKIDREELKVALAEARALGDLKENAEYHAAKEKQSHLEGRIMELQSKLAKAKVIDPSKTSSEKIVFGATVTIYDEAKDKNVIYQIVGEDEADLAGGKISYLSPLGQALIGKEVGDEIIVKAPKGDVIYQVEKLDYK
jgi:transcription elongation factor GreA